MVWIHGGGFITGLGGPAAYAPDYLMDSDNKVVLVEINYRLGALGFMTLENDVIAGNMGLKDQNMALQVINLHTLLI